MASTRFWYFPHIATALSFSLVVSLPLAGALYIQPVQAQPIPERGQGSTNTQINHRGNRFDIEGGRQARGNLFHSFEQFNLDRNQTATFVARPGIRNILGRVTGGNPSLIKGRIRVQGGTPNLFLMNPAGIIFSSGASVNVPSAFTATTATGIGFQSGWFSATGTNDYAALLGNPTEFAFTANQPGSIVNAGNLTTNQNLMLTGGTVVNTGNLSALGIITLAAVPSKHVARLTQGGGLLTLTITVQSLPTDNQPNTWTLPVSALPQLLTGRQDIQEATGLGVNSNGQIVLTGSELTTNAGVDNVIVFGEKVIVQIDSIRMDLLAFFSGTLSTPNSYLNLPSLPASSFLLPSSTTTFDKPPIPNSESTTTNNTDAIDSFQYSTLYSELIAFFDIDHVVSQQNTQPMLILDEGLRENAPDCNATEISIDDPQKPSLTGICLTLPNRPHSE